MRSRSSLSSERGLTIVEVLASALILAILLGGAVAALVSAKAFSSDQQRRAQAATLAQQDEDRLRGMSVNQLTALSTIPRTVTLSGLIFTVTSTAQFVTEATGASSCATSGSADVIQTVSTVTWPTIRNGPPVIASGEIAPPAGGSLIVQVNNAAGAGVPGMTVTGTATGSGSATFSGSTGSGGCMILGSLPGGDYNVTVSQPGFVDKDGNSTPPSVQQAVTVVPGASATKSFTFDQAASISATFKTTPYGGNSPTLTTDAADTVLIANNQMAAGYRSAGTLGTFATPVTATGLFPFTVPSYDVYAGSCSADAPAANGQPSNPSVDVAPGGSATVQVTLPSLHLTVWSGTSSASPGSRVISPHVVLYDQGCGGTPPTARGTPITERSLPTNGSGQLVNPGTPFGTFAVCADNGSRLVASASVAQNNVSTGTTLDFYLGATSLANSGGNYAYGAVGACP